MLIKPQQLSSSLQNVIYPLYCLFGSNQYQMNELTELINQVQREKGSTEETQLVVEKANDWIKAFEQANSYGLFYDRMTLKLIYAKKSMEASVKNLIQRYLVNPNHTCTLIIHAAQMTATTLSWLNKVNHAAIVPVMPLPAHSMMHWINKKLDAAKLIHTPDITQLIQQFTQGNQHACEQLIQKLTLTSQNNTPLTTQTVLMNLIDQSDYSLYELSEACLQGDGLKAMRVLRFAQHKRLETTLVLWIISQEIRLLIQLHAKIAQGNSWSQATHALNVWSNKIKFYQTALDRLKKNQLVELLKQSQRIDQTIKTNSMQNPWIQLEKLVLGFC